MNALIKDWLTENDGTSYCYVSALSIVATLVMLGEFVYRHSVDFQGLGIGLTTLWVGKAIKTWSEK